MVVFSLTRWSSLVPTGFLVSRRTLDTHSLKTISLTGLLPSLAVLSNTLQLSFLVDFWVLHPVGITTYGLGSSDFARHYFRNRFYFLFLRVIRCFSSPGSLRHTYFIQYAIPRHYSWWVPSFGYLRISVYLRLPVAFRSLSRPSSAPCTKASSCMLFVAWSFFWFAFLHSVEFTSFLLPWLYSTNFLLVIRFPTFSY